MSQLREMVDEIKIKLSEETERSKQLPLFVDKGSDKLSPWQPANDPIEVAFWGKALEELGELSAIISRCMIQGVNECEPSTGKLNKSALAEEIADVKAMIEIIMTFNNIPEFVLDERMAHKKAKFHRWINILVRCE